MDKKSVCPLLILEVKMPLIKSKSNKARNKNVAEMIKAGHPIAQAVAASYSIQRKAKKEK